jgi:hypothetical protein
MINLEMLHPSPVRSYLAIYSDYVRRLLISLIVIVIEYIRAWLNRPFLYDVKRAKTLMMRRPRDNFKRQFSMQMFL